MDIRRGGLLWKHIIVKQCNLPPPPKPNKQWLRTTAQRGTCKNMLNIYLAQLFSNSDCGNEKGCLGGGGSVSRQLRVCREKRETKNKFTSVWFLLFIFDITGSYPLCCKRCKIAIFCGAIFDFKTASIDVFYIFLNKVSQMHVPTQLFVCQNHKTM